MYEKYLDRSITVNCSAGIVGRFPGTSAPRRVLAWGCIQTAKAPEAREGRRKEEVPKG